MENKQINYIENDIVNDFNSEITFEDLLKHVAKQKEKKNKI